VDLGDRLGRNGWFGYRVNLLSGGGTGYVDHSSLTRKLGSFAVDLKPFERTTVELNYSYYRYRKMGYPGSFAYAGNVPLPDAPDPTRVGYGQSFAGSLLTTKTASFRVRHEFSPDWKLVLGMLDQDVTRDMSVPANTLNASGGYRTTISSTAASRFGLVSNMAYLSGHFRTGAIRHDLSVGTTGLQWTTYASARTTTVVLGNGSINAPVTYPVPAWPVTPADYKSGITRQQGLNLNDTLTFNDHWAFGLSASEDWIQNYSYSAAQVKTTAYKGSGFSGAGSLLFKPSASVTSYFTYANSLQQPDSAPTTAANAGTFLTPYRSTQYELGVKSRLAAIDLGAALFRMERPFAYADPADNVFKVMGNQVNYGAELTAQGNLAERLYTNAGLTILDPRLRKTSLAVTSGKQVVGVPRVQSNLLMEYRWPGADAWATNLDWHYTGKRPANDTNSYWAKAYSTVDWGLRYAARSWKVPTTVRLNVNNLFGEHYWYSIFPGSINGTNSSASAFLGEPREIKLSAQLTF
jgi:iron complex outermembrane receptor protein